MDPALVVAVAAGIATPAPVSDPAEATAVAAGRPIVAERPMDPADAVADAPGASAPGTKTAQMDEPTIGLNRTVCEVMVPPSQLMTPPSEDPVAAGRPTLAGAATAPPTATAAAAGSGSRPRIESDPAELAAVAVGMSAPGPSSTRPAPRGVVGREPSWPWTRIVCGTGTADTASTPETVIGPPDAVIRRVWVPVGIVSVVVTIAI
jgi:hypothetical protein